MEEGVSLMMADQSTDLGVEQNVLRTHFIFLHSISKAVIFGFPLGHWPLLSRVLGHVSSVRDGFYLGVGLG